MRKIFSLLTAILFAGSMMADSFAPKALADITADDVVIVTIDNGSGVYALANDNGTSAAPTAVAVTVTDGKISSDATNILWTLTKDGDNLSFAAGESNLYCTNSNNGVRVGSSTGTFIISNDYLCCTSTSSNRYLGVYNSQDWRCYTTINSNIQNQTLAFYVKETEQGGGGETPAHTYTVAGSSAELFGTAWTPSEEANDMTLVEGLYTWEKENLTLAAGTIEFKVCEDHAWTTAYPAQNYQLNIPEAGIYTVTITFNAETKEVSAVATKTGSAVVVPTVAMHGNFLGSWADTENFAIAEGNATASLTLNIEAGDYEFGMRIGGSGNWTANGVAFTRENASAVVEAGSGNLKLAADVAGDYIFTWTYETNTLAITFPEAGGGDTPEPPTPDPEGAYTLTFNYYDNTGGDKSTAETTLEGLFSAASMAYVDADAEKTIDKVYLGRKYKDDVSGDSIFSNVKFGTSSAAGTLKFALKNMDVDSVIFRAAMYGTSEGGDGFSVNGTQFTLSRGNKKFEDLKYVPEGEISAFEIVQTTANKGRFYLTSITVYPKAGEAPAEPKFYITGDSALLADAAADATLAWNPAAIKSMETSYKLNLKANQAYKLKVTLDGTWGEGKVKGFADLTTTADGLTADGDGNICFSLNTAGEVNVHYDGEFFFLNGDFYVAPAPAKKYYLKNNWAGGDWAWKELEYVEENEDYELIAVFGGNGVNLNTAESDEGAKWIAAEDIVAFDAAYDPAELGALDTVVFFFDPEAVNQYTGENGLTALIIGKYIPAPVAAFYITGDSALVADAAADATLAWNPAAIKSMETSYKLNLKADQEYKLKVTLDGTFAEGKVKGFSDLTTTADGLSADADNNICFKLNTAGEVNVHYDGEFFFLNGDFYVAPAPAKKYYLKNNWDGGDWAWKELEYVEENEDYELIAVFGGTGVNLNTAESDEGATWIAAADIVTFDAAYDPAELGALDTVVFYFDPEAVNQYTGENGLSALIIGKYVKPVDPEEHTYTVAGSSTDLFGTAWTPSEEANDMTLVEGLYTWEKTDLTLAAGNIEFKVCEDHAWTTAYPAQNYQLNIPEAGIYTVTITFNAETKEVAAVATKTGSAVVVPTVAMHGNFLGSWADTENFAIAEGNATASLTLNIEAGDYEFGMRIGGSGNWTANGVAFTRENPSAVIVAGSGNLKLAADKAGEYTFTWTYETNTLAITFPNGSGTGVDNAVVDVKAVKVIRDNQILIIKGDKAFNIQGQLVK